MTTPTAPTAGPPPALAILDAVETLDTLIRHADGAVPVTMSPMSTEAIRTLLVAHSDLARRHGEQTAELERTREARDGYRDRWLAERMVTAAHRNRAAALLALVAESGRHVDGVEVERLLDDRS